MPSTCAAAPIGVSSSERPSVRGRGLGLHTDDVVRGRGRPVCRECTGRAHSSWCHTSRGRSRCPCHTCGASVGVVWRVRSAMGDAHAIPTPLRRH
eukprot:1893256-Prymnesium_polylepis.1